MPHWRLELCFCCLKLGVLTIQSVSMTVSLLDYNLLKDHA